MGDTGHNWGAWADMTYNVGTDVDGIDINDNAALITDEIDLDGKAGCEISVLVVEGGDGAVASPWTLIQVLRGDDEVYQAAATAGPTIVDIAWSFVVIPVQGASRIQVFNVDPRYVGKFKLNFVNDCGQDLDLTLRIRTATIPVAS